MRKQILGPSLSKNHSQTYEISFHEGHKTLSARNKTTTENTHKTLTGLSGKQVLQRLCLQPCRSNKSQELLHNITAPRAERSAQAPKLYSAYSKLPASREARAPKGVTITAWALQEVSIKVQRIGFSASQSHAVRLAILEKVVAFWLLLPPPPKLGLWPQLKHKALPIAIVSASTMPMPQQSKNLTSRLQIKMRTLWKSTISSIYCLFQQDCGSHPFLRLSSL